MYEAIEFHLSKSITRTGPRLQMECVELRAIRVEHNKTTKEGEKEKNSLMPQRMGLEEKLEQLEMQLLRDRRWQRLGLRLVWG